MRYLIVNGDDFGMCHSANTAIQDLADCGGITSTTILTMAGWAAEAVHMIHQDPHLHPGVHLAHTSEWNGYRWHSLSGLPSLADAEGMLPHTTAEALKIPMADRLAECRAQIRWAERNNLKITHLDNHMMTLDDDPMRLLELCAEYGLGCRYPLHQRQDPACAAYVEAHGIPCIDWLNPGDGLDYPARLHQLPEGITEFFTHPAADSEELRSIAPDWQVRVNDYRFFRSDEFRKILAEESIRLIGYEDIADIRAGRKQ